MSSRSCASHSCVQRAPVLVLARHSLHHCSVCVSCLFLHDTKRLHPLSDHCRHPLPARSRASESPITEQTPPHFKSGEIRAKTITTINKLKKQCATAPSLARCAQDCTLHYTMHLRTRHLHTTHHTIQRQTPHEETTQQQQQHTSKQSTRQPRDGKSLQQHTNNNEQTRNKEAFAPRYEARPCSIKGAPNIIEL